MKTASRSRYLLSSLAVLAAGLLISAPSARALETTFTGSTSSDFNNAANYNGGLPTSTTNVALTTSFVNQPNITASISVGGIYLDTKTATKSATFSSTGNVVVTIATGTFDGNNNNLIALGDATAGSGLTSTSNLTFNSSITLATTVSATGPISGLFGMGSASYIREYSDGTLTINGGLTNLSTGAATTVALIQVGAPGGANASNVGTGSVVINGVISDQGTGHPTTAFGDGGNNSFNVSTVYLSGVNTYSGGTQLGGTVNNLGATNEGLTNTIINNKAALGTGAVALNVAELSASTNLTGANALANAFNIANLGSGAGTGTGFFGGANSIEIAGTTTIASTSTANNGVNNDITGAGNELILSGAVNLGTTGTPTETFAGSGTTLVSGNIANGGTSTAALTYSGTGLLRLTGANTYTGPTTVTSGNLEIDGTSAAGSAVTVAGAANPILSGFGTINGNVTIGSATTTGTIAPGTVGTANVLVLNQNLTINSGTTFQFDLGANSGSSDQIDVTGVFNGAATGGTYTFNFNNLTTPTGGTTYDLINYGSAGGNLAVGNFNAVGDTGTFNLNAGQLDFTIAAVPEPSTWVMMTLGLLALGTLAWRRRTVCA